MITVTHVKKQLLVLLLSGCALLSRAQNQNSTHGEYGIKGVVIDSASGQPLGYVTVSLSRGNEGVRKTVLSGTDGRFGFSGLVSGTYSLTMMLVGHQRKKLEIKVDKDDAGTKNIGTVLLGHSNNDLKEVVVSAERPVIKQEIDRLSYDLEADPDSKASNVLEMMRKVPMLSVDAEDNILLKGDRNYKILLNGKPSGMLERSPKEILKSMPASSIVRIEVITTPPAKYDGEGLTGIINIITNKRIDNGYNGSLNVNGRFPANGPGTGGSLNLKSGKFGLGINGGGNVSDVPAVGSSRFRETFGGSPTMLVQSVSQESNGNSGYFNTELSFEIDSLNLISGQFNINGNKWNNDNLQYSELQGADLMIQRYNLVNDYLRKGRGSDAGLNYQMGFKSDKNRLLTFSYRYYGFVNTGSNNISIYEAVNFYDPEYRQKNEGRFSEQTLQADYVHPFKKITIETGIKAIFRNNKSDFGYDSFDADQGIFVRDPARTNVFKNTQNIYSFYNTYQYTIGGWGFKAGFRVEKTVIDADFVSAATQLNRDYTSLIPSVSVNRKLTDNSNLNFGYTTRIQRPGIDLLNPFTDRSNPNFESSGNPALRTASVDMFQLNYSTFKKGNLNIGLLLGFFDDLVMPMSYFDPETNISYTSYGNTGSARMTGMEFAFSYPLTKKWKYSLNANFGYGKVNGVVNGEKVSNKGLMPSIFSSTDYKMDKGWRFSANVSYYGRGITLQGRSNGIVGSGFSVNREVVKDKLTFSLAANNLFTKYRESENRTTGTDFIQQSNNRSYFRSFSASLDYRFGKLKESIKKSRRGIRNDDVAGGGN